MAGFHNKLFTKHDDYMTPRYAWENIKHLIPRDKIIWEAFYGFLFPKMAPIGWATFIALAYFIAIP